MNSDSETAGPQRTEKGASLTETLGRTIKQVQYRHHRAVDTGLANVGTTLAQWDALRAICRHPGASAHDLAVYTFQSDQAFGTLANRLIKQGLIERRPGHGRRIEHHLTDTGGEILEVGYPVSQAVLKASFADLTVHEQATLLDLLRRVVDRPLQMG